MNGQEKPVTVLIVEDEYITGADIQTSLLDMGYHAPFVIDNGPEAIRKTLELHPDIVLMDITLAGAMSGIEAAARIRDESGIPVIFLTAHSDEPTFEQARVTEPLGYIIKPFEPRSLRISIEMARYKYALDEKLRASEERYRGFVQNFLGIAYRRSEDAALSFLHGATEAVTGYPESAFSSGTVTWDMLIHPDDRVAVWEMNRIMQASGEYSGTREYRIIRKDGELRWIYELVQKVNGSSPRTPPFIQGACYDVTDRKNAEEAVRIANRKLNLLNNITRHDILNSLHGLLGLIEMAHDTITEESAKQLLSDMEFSARQIQKQITFTRNYQDVGVKAPVWQGVRECIGQAGEGLSPGVVSVTVTLPEEYEIFADPLLVKVFYNLIDNALRYGERLTTIRFSGSAPDSDLVLVCEDDGIGIPSDEKDHIFEQCVGKNTGMGLFLSREILMITGIVIRECGTPGQGARFEMVVPPGSWRRRLGCPEPKNRNGFSNSLLLNTYNRE